MILRTQRLKEKHGRSKSRSTLFELSVTFIFGAIGVHLPHFTSIVSVLAYGPFAVDDGKLLYQQHAFARLASSWTLLFKRTGTF